jgi:tetratricopeptide (TPR) repeat protein
MLMCVGLVRASEQRMEQARLAYDSAQYDQVIQIYDSLAAAGFYDFSLFYNTGNTWYQLGEPAKAMLCYEKALLLNPLSKDALNNLDLTRKALGFDPISGERKGISPLINNLMMGLHPNSWFAFFLISWCLVFVFIAVARLQKKQWPYWMSGGIFVIGLSCLLFGLGHVNRLHTANTAVALRPSVQIRESPTPDSKKITSVPEGTHLEIIRSKADEGWVEVSVNSVQGWVNVEDVGIVSVLDAPK